MEYGTVFIAGRVIFSHKT